MVSLVGYDTKVPEFQSNVWISNSWSQSMFLYTCRSVAFLTPWNPHLPGDTYPQVVAEHESISGTVMKDEAKCVREPRTKSMKLIGKSSYKITIDTKRNGGLVSMSVSDMSAYWFTKRAEPCWQYGHNSIQSVE